MLFWNVRELNDSFKLKRLVNILQHYKLNLVCLLETHVQKEQQTTILERVFPNCQHVDNCGYAQLGRI